MEFLKNAHRRRGLALTEMALLLVLLLMLVFGVMEYGWMFLKLHEVTNSSRRGARLAVLPDATNQEVQDAITSLMTAAGMGSSGYQVNISAADITLLNRGDPLTISVSVPYTNVGLLGMPWFPEPTNLVASVSMAKEGP